MGLMCKMVLPKEVAPHSRMSSQVERQTPGRITTSPRVRTSPIIRPKSQESPLPLRCRHSSTALRAASPCPWFSRPTTRQLLARRLSPTGLTPTVTAGGPVTAQKVLPPNLPRSRVDPETASACMRLLRVARLPPIAARAWAVVTSGGPKRWHLARVALGRAILLPKGTTWMSPRHLSGKEALVRRCTCPTTTR